MARLLKDRDRVPELWLILVAVLALIPANVLGTDLLYPSTAVVPAPIPSPRLSLPGGCYEHDVQVALSLPSAASTILFTLDGSIPTHASGTVYVHPIRLSARLPAVTVIRARAVLPGGELGPVVSASYFVGLSANLPMLSLIVDRDDLWGAEKGIYANYKERGRAWERAVEVTYVDQDRSSGFHAPAGIRLHGEWTRAYDKKSFRLYFRQEYGLAQLEYPLFDQGELQSFERLVLHNGGNDSPQPTTNWTLLRNQLVTDLALQLGVIVPRSRPTLVFLNGEPWGIYHIRERIDDQFLVDHYGIESADLLDSPAHTEVRFIAEGDRVHWDHLLAFCETHDLADPENYAYVQTQVDVANLIDYTILQIYSGNADWPEHNVNQFRARRPGSRWRWIIWDNDYSFGLYLPQDTPFEGALINLNMLDKALSPDNLDTAGYDTLLLRSLIENQDFRKRFASRAAHLLNTTFAPEAVVTRIDALAAGLAPDINYEIGRWAGGISWEASVQEMREYVWARTDVIRQHFVEAFGPQGTASFSFFPPSEPDGSIAVDGDPLPELPWQGVYFRGTDVQITAVPEPGYRFIGWEGLDTAQGPVITTTVSEAMAWTPRFGSVERGALRPGDVVFTERHMDGDDIQGGWFELMVMRRGGVDMRGWRITDNDTKTATDEGSLIFTDRQAFRHIPRGTTIRILAIQTDANDIRFPRDDLGTWDRSMVLYVGNGHLDVDTDPFFSLVPADNLVLVAPGPTAAFDDDLGIDFVSGSAAVTPASFGVLADGVTASRALQGSGTAR